jgi:hypothetical protein
MEKWLAVSVAVSTLIFTASYIGYEEFKASKCVEYYWSKAKPSVGDVEDGKPWERYALLEKEIEHKCRNEN